MDISEAMLDVALDREVEGDLCVGDLGQGLPFRTGTFDGAISISAVQWLCNAVRLPTVEPAERRSLLYLFVMMGNSQGQGTVE